MRAQERGARCMRFVGAAERAEHDDTLRIALFRENAVRKLSRVLVDEREGALRIASFERRICISQDGRFRIDGRRTRRDGGGLRQGAGLPGRR